MIPCPHTGPHLLYLKGTPARHEDFGMELVCTVVQLDGVLVH